MLDEVLNTISKHKLIAHGEKVITGISGGPDSVCLLHVLNSLKDRLEIQLYAVHINHMLRGGESDEDERYVRDFCRSLGVPLIVEAHPIGSIARQKRISLEEAGREVRYSAFERAAAAAGAQKIAVAHNRNDQAETVLMNIIRGSGLDGLKGISFSRGSIIRPLLETDRPSIEAYCLEHGLQPRTDSSNLQSLYTRNKIRLDLIPFINEKFGSDIVNSLSRLASLARDDLDFISVFSESAYRHCLEKHGEDHTELSLKGLKELHPAVLKQVLRLAVKSVKGDLKGLESIHVEDAVSLIGMGRTGAILHFPGNIRLEKTYGTLRFYLDKAVPPTADFEIQLQIPGKTLIQELKLCIETFIEKDVVNIEHYSNIRYNSLVQVFDYDLLKKGINIRNRKTGDIFKPFGSTGTKKLKEYLIDEKIPRKERDKIPLLAMANEIVWIVGHKISDKFKVTENTKTVLKISCSFETQDKKYLEDSYVRGH